MEVPVQEVTSNKPSLTSLVQLYEAQFPERRDISQRELRLLRAKCGGASLVPPLPLIGRLPSQSTSVKVLPDIQVLLSGIASPVREDSVRPDPFTSVVPSVGSLVVPPVLIEGEGNANCICKCRLSNKDKKSV